MNTTGRKSENRLQALLDDDHDFLDALFERFRERKSSQSDERLALFDRLTTALEDHIGWEEDVLFPLFESRVDRLDVTRTLRVEHRAILRELDSLRSRLTDGNKEEEPEANRLRALLNRHNRKEEEAFYPVLDQFMESEEIRELVREIQTIRCPRNIRHETDHRSLKELSLENLDRLAGLFQVFRTVRKNRSGRARDLLDRFDRELRAHIAREEKHVFPVYRRELSHTGHLDRMKVEHSSLLRWLKTIITRREKGHRNNDWNEKRIT